MSDQITHRLFVRGVESFPPITVDGIEYDGGYLSLITRINPANIHEEAINTPQLIAELGRLVAAAARAKSKIELDYRFWRDSEILRVITDPDEAKAEGLTDGHKPSTSAAAESWVRTLSEYVVWSQKVALAEEAWTTLSFALDAAKARTQAIQFYQRNGVEVAGGGQERKIERNDPPLAQLQQEVASQERTPIPTTVSVSGPPPPPPRPPGGGAPPPPPPPKRS